MTKRIVVVDDAKHLARGLAEVLEMEGFETKFAFDGIEALSLMRTFVPNLVVTDLRMPKMDGVELYLKLKKIDGKIKACFITAFETDRFMDNKEKYPDLQATCFIKKPIMMKDLVETVNRRLGS